MKGDREMTNAVLNEKERLERYNQKRKCENFAKRMKSIANVLNLEESINKHLTEKYSDLDIETYHSRSTVRTMSFYIEVFNPETEKLITIKVSDHNTISQEATHDSIYMEYAAFTGIKELKETICRAIDKNFKEEA